MPSIFSSDYWFPSTPQKYDPKERISKLRSAIGYDNLTGADRAYADEYLKYHESLPDVASWSDDWINEIAGKFGESASANRLKQDTNRARERYGELTNINSEYNQGVYNRIKRLNAPDTYQDSLLYRAMGLSADSSANLAQNAQRHLERKASDRSYSQFQETRERAEGAAQGYLELASGKEASLLQIMTNTRLQEQQLEQQAELAERERTSQLWNSIAKTVIGGGISLLAPYLAPVAAGANAMDYMFSYDGANRMRNYDPGLRP